MLVQKVPWEAPLHDAQGSAVALGLQCHDTGPHDGPKRIEKEGKVRKWGTRLDRLGADCRAQLGLRGTPKYMQHDSKPNTAQTRGAHKIGANSPVVYSTQPNKIQTTGLVIRADGKTQS